MRSKVFSRKNPLGSYIVTHARVNPTGDVDDLVLFATNDGTLYRQSAKPIIENLAKKMAKGTYDPTAALKAWGYFVENGARKYAWDVAHKRKPGTTSWHQQGIDGNGLFPKSVRDVAARAVAENYAEELADRAAELRTKGKAKKNPSAPKVGATIQIPWAYDFANGYVELRVRHARGRMVEGTVTKATGEAAHENAVGDVISTEFAGYRTVKAGAKKNPWTHPTDPRAMFDHYLKLAEARNQDWDGSSFTRENQEAYLNNAAEALAGMKEFGRKVSTADVARLRKAQADWRKRKALYAKYAALPLNKKPGAFRWYLEDRTAKRKNPPTSGLIPMVVPSGGAAWVQQMPAANPGWRHNSRKKAKKNPAAFQAGDYRPRTKVGTFYKKGNDILRVDDVGYTRRGGALRPSDWEVLFLGTMTDVPKTGPSPYAQAAHHHMAPYEIERNGYRKVKAESLNENWRAFFARHKP